MGGKGGVAAQAWFPPRHLSHPLGCQKSLNPTREARSFIASVPLFSFKISSHHQSELKLALRYILFSQPTRLLSLFST